MKTRRNKKITWTIWNKLKLECRTFFLLATHWKGQCKREVHQIEAHQARKSMRRQVWGPSHASDAAASNSARRDHGEHSRRQTTKEEKEDVRREHLLVARCDRCVLFTATLNPKKPSKADLNILKHRQQPKTIRNRVAHPSTAQHSPEHFDRRETIKKEQLKTNWNNRKTT